jgi:hypothetical protein
VPMKSIHLRWVFVRMSKVHACGLGVNDRLSNWLCVFASYLH